MIALTLTQPWATLVVLGVKRFETRSWSPAGRALPLRVAVHAAKSWRTEDRWFAEDLRKRGVIPAGTSLPLGAVVGEVTVVAVHETGAVREDLPRLERELGDFTDGRQAWELADPVAYPEPIAASGALGLWTWERPA